MEFCFNHPEIKATATCPFCGKGYCASCLQLVGQRKIVICQSCYAIMNKKVQQSVPRKRVLAGAALVTGVLCLAYGVYALASIDTAAGLIALLIGVVNLGAAGLNIVRIRQASEWNLIEPFQPAEQNRT